MSATNATNATSRADTAGDTLPRLDIEPARTDRHDELIHSWMNLPHVAPWWELDRPLDEIHAYLDGLTHLRPWIASADDTPFAYVETYRTLDDPLASHYPARATDVGWHLLVGPEEYLGSGVPRLLGRTFLRRLLFGGQHDHEPVDRVVCEPDIRNTRMHAFCRRLGFQPAGEIDLPDKRALLMTCTSEQFVDACQPVDSGGRP